MSWALVIDPYARKKLGTFPSKDQKRIIDAMQKDMCANPFSGDTKKMTGEDSWRRRVGSYRIEFELYVQDKAINVYSIDRRTSTTYRKRR